MKIRFFVYLHSLHIWEVAWFLATLHFWQITWQIQIFIPFQFFDLRSLCYYLKIIFPQCLTLPKTSEVTPLATQLSLILVKKVVLKLKLPKNNFIKKCAHKFLLFNKKKDQKDSNDFWHRVWKSNFVTSWWSGKSRPSIPVH